MAHGLPLAKKLSQFSAASSMKNSLQQTGWMPVRSQAGRRVIAYFQAGASPAFDLNSRKPAGVLPRVASPSSALQEQQATSVTAATYN